MRGPWRAALALALHIGFLVLPVGLALCLLAMAAYTFRYEPASGLRSGVAAVVVTAIVVVILRALLRTKSQPQGVEVGGDAQPQLWRTVTGIAEQIGAPPPDRIRITAEPVVRIRSNTTLLGLYGRGTDLEIGLPLVAGFTVGELRAVLAREIGHLSAGGRITALAHRTAVAVDDAAAQLTGGPTKWIFLLHARPYAALTRPVSRRLELDADRAGARVAGRRVASATLRKSIGIELGWRDYSAEYLSMAVTVERTPDLLLGFKSLLDHPDRKANLAERAKQAITAEAEESAAGGAAHGSARTAPSWTVTYNPVATRLEAMRQLSAKDDKPDDRPAVALIRNPRRSVPALEDQLMVDGIGPRVPWPELVRMAGAHEAAERAARLSSAVLDSGVSADPTVAGVLQAIHQGQGAELINPALNPGLDPDRVDEAVVDTLTELLGAAVVDALVRADRAHHVLDWGGPPSIQLANGHTLDPDRLVRPAVADPRLVPGLHRHLLHLGVPLDHAQPAAADPEPVLAGIVSPVQVERGLHELLVTDRGLLLLPSQAGTAQRLLAGALALARRGEDERLAELANTPVDELRGRTGAQWVDSRDVATAKLRQQRSGWSLSMELYLDEYAVSDLDPAMTEDSDTDGGAAVLTLGATADSVERGEPYSGLGELMGARMDAEDEYSRAE